MNTTITTITRNNKSFRGNLYRITEVQFQKNAEK